MIRFFMRHGLYLAWVITLIATLSSLYYSEVLKWEPCKLCWYQRTSIFPLTIILGIAAFRMDRKIVDYVLPVVVIGALFSIYQIIERKLPISKKIPICGLNADCLPKQYEFFGVFSIPFMSLLVFLLILFFLVLAQKVEIHATGKPVSNAQTAIFSLMGFCKENRSTDYNSKMMLRGKCIVCQPSGIQTKCFWR